MSEVKTPLTDVMVEWCDRSERDNGDFWPTTEFIHFARQLERDRARLIGALEEQRRQMDFPGLPAAFVLTMKRMIDDALSEMEK